MTETSKPYWAEEKNYPPFESTPNEQWAWEFLRRNPKYKEEWQTFVDSGIEPNPIEMRRQFGVNGLADPKTRWRDGGIWIPTGEHCWRKLAFTQAPVEHELIIKFNVFEDIEKQLAEARWHLQVSRELRTMEQKGSKRPESVVIRKRTEFIRYLQLLDAETALESMPENEFLAHVQPYLMPVFADTRQSKQEAANHLRKSLRRARKLRDGGYVSLGYADITDSGKPGRSGK